MVHCHADGRTSCFNTRHQDGEIGERNVSCGRESKCRVERGRLVLGKGLCPSRLTKQDAANCKTTSRMSVPKPIPANYLRRPVYFTPLSGFHEPCNLRT